MLPTRPEVEVMLMKRPERCSFIRGAATLSLRLMQPLLCSTANGGRHDSRVSANGEVWRDGVAAPNRMGRFAGTVSRRPTEWGGLEGRCRGAQPNGEVWRGPPRPPPTSSSARVERRHVSRAHDEDDRRVVHEHDEGDEDGERPVDLVVDADLTDVQPEELLGDLPQDAGHDAAGQRGADAHAAIGHVAVAEIEHYGRDL